MRSFERAKNLVEVVARLIEWQPAEPVVPTEFDDYGIGVKAQNRWEAGNRVLGGGSAGTLIDDFVVVALCIQMSLQRIGKRLAFSEAVARGNAVAKADQHVCRGGGKNAMAAATAGLKRELRGERPHRQCSCVSAGNQR